MHGQRAHREALLKVLSLLRDARSELLCRCCRFPATASSTPRSRVCRCALVSTAAVTSVFLFVAVANAFNSSAKPSRRSLVRLGVRCDCPTSGQRSARRLTSATQGSTSFLLDVVLRQCSCALPAAHLPDSVLTRICVSSRVRDTLDVEIRQCSVHACQAVENTTGSFALFASALQGLERFGSRGSRSFVSRSLLRWTTTPESQRGQR